MSKVDREIARTIRAFRLFMFKCPTGKVERAYRQLVIRWWLAVSGLVICVGIISITHNH